MRDDCELPPERVRPVLRAVRDYPVVLPELLDLAVWMHERYLCNLVDALRLMIPAQMRGDRVRARTVRVARLKVSRAEAEAFARENPAREGAGGNRRKALGGGRAARAGAAGVGAEGAGSKGRCGDRRRGSAPDALRAARVRRRARPGADAGPEARRRRDRGARSSAEAAVFAPRRDRKRQDGAIRISIVIRRALELGRTAIVLVPEIALTPQMVSWLHARFGADAAVLHSRLSAGERYDEWRRIRFGEARVVIGARSAVFAPVENLGAIVVDEEHEHTYQSDRRPRYDAREVARRRAEAHGAALILGSATPSVSTYMRAMPGVRRENRLELIELRERVHGRPLPEVEVVDMRGEFERGNHSIFSARLVRALEECLGEGRQPCCSSTGAGTARSSPAARAAMWSSASAATFP